jgi:hypothetical protein
MEKENTLDDRHSFCSPFTSFGIQGEFNRAIPIMVSLWGFVASWITGRLDLSLDLTFNVRPVEESGHTSSRSVKDGAGIFLKIPSDYFDVVIHGVFFES